MFLEWDLDENWPISAGGGSDGGGAAAVVIVVVDEEEAKQWPDRGWVDRQTMQSKTAVRRQLGAAIVSGVISRSQESRESVCVCVWVSECVLVGLIVLYAEII